jgi:predicted RNA-binding Zn-ribbon protein involved in translation (DUF1610 family)
MNWKPTSIILLIVLVPLLALVMFGFDNAGPLVAAILLSTTILLIVLVTWHARNTTYSCPNCSHNFKVSALTDFISPHTPGNKRLTCPECGEKAWCPTVDA